LDPEVGTEDQRVPVPAERSRALAWSERAFIVPTYQEECCGRST